MLGGPGSSSGGSNEELLLLGPYVAESGVEGGIAAACLEMIDVACRDATHCFTDRYTGLLLPQLHA